MTLPIQTAPIDRANRAVNLNVATSSRGITPQFSLGPIDGIACEICSLLPPPFSLICRAICNQVVK
jgi:hypothetical protein